MNAPELTAILSEFATKMSADVKGLSGKLMWILYSTKHEFVRGGANESDWAEGMKTMPKKRPDWECYILAQGAGALQTHLTGLADKNGKPEENRAVGYIHQLLPKNFNELKTKCSLTSTALNARAALMTAEPVRASAILFFQMYLRSIYRAVAGTSEEILLVHLKNLPGKMEPEKLLEMWKKVEERLKTDQPAVSYELANGRFKVFTKIGKQKKLLNGWFFGEEEGEEAGEPEEKVQDGFSGYERYIEERGFHARMKLVQEEARRLLGKNADAVIDLVAEHRSGTLTRVYATIEKFTELAEGNMFPPAQIENAKLLLQKLDAVYAAAREWPRHLKALGLDIETLRERNVSSQRLKRKLHISG